jgi:starch-binding outer membrane protein, SusD/RagB family
MKKIIYLLLVVLLAFTACQDEILDKQPLDLITDVTVWNDPVLIDAFLTMQYSLTTVMVNETPSYIESWGAGSPVDGAWDILGSEHGYGPLAINNMADEGKGGWEIIGTAGFKAGRLNINGGLLEWWEYPYYIIRNLNQFIDRVSKSPVDAEFAKKRGAEARFLRAFNYFAMVKRYGGIPLITKEQKLDDPEEVLYPVRNSEQEIYDFIISEMDAIANDLPATVSAGRPNKWAALTLKSRAALYAASIAKFGSAQLNGILGIQSGQASGYYQKAYDAAQNIISNGPYSLYNADSDKVRNFRNIFLVKKNSEVIFAKQHNFVDALGGGGATWSYDFVQRPKPHAWNGGMGNTPYLEMAEEFEYKDGTSGKLDRNAIQQGLWSMQELWGNKDPRFFATLYTMETPWRGGFVDFHNGIITSDGSILTGATQAYEGVPAWGNQNLWGAGNFGTGFGVMKLLDENVGIGGTWSNSGTDYIVFRYAEVLLNFAEAAFELGKEGEAIIPVNQIRSRAGISSLSSITRDEIRHERKVELAFEGHRYWDLRRWRTATTELTRSFSGLRYILDYSTRKYKLQILNNIDGASNTPRFVNDNYYFPITLKRTGSNKNLIENPGYN